jgi:hypothetical protein
MMWRSRYNEAAELAMGAGKGKLSLRYSMAAEECYGEDDEPAATAAELAAAARACRLDVWRMMLVSNHPPPAPPPATAAAAATGIHSGPPPRVRVVRDPTITRGRRSAVPARAPPAPPAETFPAYLARHGVMAWLSREPYE